MPIEDELQRKIGIREDDVKEKGKGDIEEVGTNEAGRLQFSNVTQGSYIKKIKGGATSHLLPATIARKRNS